MGSFNNEQKNEKWLPTQVKKMQNKKEEKKKKEINK